MARKAETVLIKRSTLKKIKGVIEKYQEVLDSEIDSSVNDESVKKAYKKDLSKSFDVQAEIDEQTKFI